MEQVTLDSFANMDICVAKEREAYSIVEEALRETLTDILMIGDCECQAYSNGTYGTKVKKAMEYNKKAARSRSSKKRISSQKSDRHMTNGFLALELGNRDKKLTVKP